MRLNKLLAERVGLARRKCDTAIQDGAVEVDGKLVLEPGTSVDPDTQRVVFRGAPLPAAPSVQHWLYHKPLGVIVTWHDPQGRVTIKDVLPDFGARVFAVGRLDADTSGLLLLTNDGALAHRLAHPRYEVTKTYRLTVRGRPTDFQLNWLEDGVDLGEGEMTSKATASLVEVSGGLSVVELILAEGKKRQVRRMAKAVGLWLTALSRIAYGPLELGSLAPGSTRPLTGAEVRALRTATESAAHSARKR